MKNFTLKLFSFLLVIALTSSFRVSAQGSEDFELATATGSSYKGTLAIPYVITGKTSGTTWTCLQVRTDLKIGGVFGVTLAKAQPPISMTSSSIPGGMGTLTLSYKQPFGTNAKCLVKVNGATKATLETTATATVITQPIVVNVEGPVVLSFEQFDATAGQIVIDDISWTGFVASAPFANASAVTFDRTLVGGKSTKQVTVTGGNLTGDLTVSIPTGPFSTTTTTITAAQAMAAGGYTFDVDFNPTVSAVVSEKITITGTGINVTGDLSATGYQVVNVPNIALLKANMPPLHALVSVDEYILTGEAVLTHFVANRYQKFVQDATGAVTIDDAANIIKTTYKAGDGITGLRGRISNYYNLAQFLVNADPGVATSSNNPVVPQEMTIDEFKQNIALHQSKLVKIHNLVVTPVTTVANYEKGKSYKLQKEAVETGVELRTSFDADYLTTPIHTGSIDIIGIAGQYNTTAQITPRSSADFLAPTPIDQPEPVIKESIFTANGKLLVKAAKAQTIAVYTMLGQMVSNVKISEGLNQLSLEKRGVYLVKMGNITRKVVL